MDNKYFVHEIRTGNATFKGIVICDTLDGARQTYHAFLGAYAYGHDEDTIFADAMITGIDGSIYAHETWLAPGEAPVEE